jgi:hypothetical protein
MKEIRRTEVSFHLKQVRVVKDHIHKKEWIEIEVVVTDDAGEHTKIVREGDVLTAIFEGETAKEV